MYKMKYILGDTVNYQRKICKIIGIRFTCAGIMYRLSGIREWIKESEIIKVGKITKR